MVGVVHALDVRGRPRRRLRGWALAAAAGLVIALAAPLAGAASVIYVATDRGAKRHPKTLVTHQPGVTYRFTSLSWKNWGKSRPEARGKLLSCANMADCEQLGSAKLQLRTLRSGKCEGVRGRYYMRGTITLNGKKTPLDLDPSYVC